VTSEIDETESFIYSPRSSVTKLKNTIIDYRINALYFKYEENM